MAQLTGDLTISFDSLADLDTFKDFLAQMNGHELISEDRGLFKVVLRIDEAYSTLGE